MATILVVDDSKGIREFCEMELTAAGYRVLVAADGRDAVRDFRIAEVDLVVLDIRMPRLNGLETIEELRAINPEIPVIFFTAYHKQCRRDYRGQAANAWVEKTEDLSELRRVIAETLSRHRK